MIRMFNIGFIVEGVDGWAATMRDAGFLNERAFGGLQVLANPKLPGFDKLLPIHAPERMIVCAAKQLALGPDLHVNHIRRRVRIARASVHVGCAKRSVTHQ